MTDVGRTVQPPLGLPNEVWLNDNLYVAYNDQFIMLAGARKGEHQFWVDITARDKTKSNVLKDWVEQEAKFSYQNADVIMIASVGAHHLLKGMDSTNLEE